MLSSVRWLETEDPATDGTLRFAAQELARYARRITGERWDVHRARTFGEIAGTAWLGLCGWLPQPATVELAPAPWDDGFALWITGDSLYIVGRNARSVLFGVYAFLERQGVRFLRPGPQGEVIPQRPALLLPEGPIVEQAWYRHRGVCIEGASSLEHALGMIDWCAKKRMNTLFLQFFTSRYFYNFWYARPYNPRFAGHELGDEEARALDQEVIGALKRRGLVFHRVGHGWTALTVGLPRSGWVTADEPVPEDRVRWLAQVDGERKLFREIPINTELCYSYQPAFNALVENIVRYCEVHPEVDVVHVWLSDASNNKCECEACRKLSISDWYAWLINALSREMGRRTPGKRFVFLCYFELWWPPEQMTIDDHGGNAIMMFAPIRRCYGHALTDDACDGEGLGPRPPLNRYVAPQTNVAFAESLAAWRKVFQGDSFDFDYHLMWANWRQLTDTVVARTYHQDLQGLKRAGLDGIVSCQSFRNFYPTGLAMTALAESLWDPSVPWAKLRVRYLEAAFGESAGYVSDYLEALERILDTGDPHWRTPPFSNADAAKLQAAARFLQASREKLRSWRGSVAEPAHRRSLEILLHHARLLQYLVEAQRAHLAGDAGGAGAALEHATGYLLRTEPRCHRYLDTYLLLRHAIQPMRQRLSS